MALSIFIFLFLIFPCLILANDNGASSAFCHNTSPVDKYEIECKNIGIDGRPLDEVLRRSSYRSVSGAARNVSLSEVGNDIRHLIIRNVVGNITITENGLIELANLTAIIFFRFNFTPAVSIFRFTLRGDDRRTREEYSNPPSYLDISPGVFRDTPNLKSFYLFGFHLLNSTLQAIGELKDRSSMRVNLRNIEPCEEVLKVYQTYTNLFTFYMHGCSVRTWTGPIFPKSASKLVWFTVYEWYLEKIKADMFQGMIKLEIIDWFSSNLTEIEANAFDDLVKLEYVSFYDNRLTILPDGLFKNNKKLYKIGFYGNDIQNLNRSNFTDMENPSFFVSIGAVEQVD